MWGVFARDTWTAGIRHVAHQDDQLILGVSEFYLKQRLSWLQAELSCVRQAIVHKDFNRPPIKGDAVIRRRWVDFVDVVAGELGRPHRQEIGCEPFTIRYWLYLLEFLQSRKLFQQIQSGTYCKRFTANLLPVWSAKLGFLQTFAAWVFTKPPTTFHRKID